MNTFILLKRLLSLFSPFITSKKIYNYTALITLKNCNQSFLRGFETPVIGRWLYLLNII